MRTTRLAPSPTGALHLGNARTFLINWLMARQLGWRIILRMEDIDGPRIKVHSDRQTIEDLRWLGLDWDEGPIYQSQRMDRYLAARDQLLSSGSAYACVCTRREVEAAASAPHAEDGSAVYPGTCRGRYAALEQAQREAGRPAAVRFYAPAEVVAFEDLFRGRQQFDVARDLGDFVIAKADGTPAYQLAVVVDDAAMQVTHIVRGDDLLDSTPRQIQLYRALRWSQRIPAYCHVPLVVGTDGRRLAKRHGDTRLSYYREQGVSAGRLRALLARWCGFPTPPDEVDVSTLLDGFSLAKLPREPIVFTAADDRWLRSAA